MSDDKNFAQHLHKDAGESNSLFNLIGQILTPRKTHDLKCFAFETTGKNFSQSERDCWSVTLEMTWREFA